MNNTNKEITKFIEWLAENDIVLSYWNPERNTLMPITYTADNLVGNFTRNEKPISGKVKRVL